MIESPPRAVKKWLHGSVGAKADELRRRFIAAGIENPATDVDAVLSWATGRNRSHLHAYPEDIISEDAHSRIEEAAQRRELREPLAYILEEREFWSLPFRVSPAALIPRPETELLVERAVELLGGMEEPLILDLGTGSGAVAVAIAKELPRCRVVATEINKMTMALAAENAACNGVQERVEFRISDMRNELPEGVFDAVVSNPPYIPSGDIDALMPEVSRYEPREALDGGPDGIRFLTTIIQKAPGRLRQGGFLLLEMDPAQIAGCAAEVRRTLAYAEPAVRRDLSGRDRVLEAAKV